MKNLRKLHQNTAQSESGKTGLRLASGWPIALLVVAIALSYWLESTYDLHERFDEFSHLHEYFEVDSLVITAILPSFAYVLVMAMQLRREVGRRADAEKTALNLALHDALTGLGNRRQLEEHFAALKTGQLHAILILDLDDFKVINDTFGHATGDAMLVDAARRLTSAAGASAQVCRFGGDEFAVVSSALKSEKETNIFANRIAIALREHAGPGSSANCIEASIGVASFRVGEMAVGDAIRNADLALYRAKENSASPYVIFENFMEEERSRRRTMEFKLRQAIVTGTVRPCFQPLVDLKSGTIVGFESLARWVDPDLGVIPPSEFIPLAEESGLISELADHLLSWSCREAVRWPSSYRLAFNLSPRQLKDRQLGLRILRILGEAGLAPSRLEVEITESSLLEDKDLAHELLRSMARLGISIAIDDFGTGYSSLYHLQEFSFNTLKIDRSFVLGMEPGNKNEVIVNTILNLSRGLGLKTIAEGIERPEQLSHLLERGCESGQGYLFGHAMTGEDVVRLIDGSAASPEAIAG